MARKINMLLESVRQIRDGEEDDAKDVDVVGDGLTDPEY